MPPLKGIDRGLSGEALKALEESGHGRRVAIVDASYDIPRWAQKVDYRGPSSAAAFKGILELLPIETNIGLDISIMRCDLTDIEGRSAEHDEFSGRAAMAFLDVIRDECPTYEEVCDYVSRLDEEMVTDYDGPDAKKGFYSIANNPEEDTLFIRTPDTLPYACVSIIVGHSQETD